MNDTRTLLSTALAAALLGCGQTASVVPLAASSSKPAVAQARSAASSANPAPPAVAEAYEREAKRSRPHEDRARELLTAGDLAGAEREAREALRVHPRFDNDGDPWMLQLLAEVKLAQGRPKEALSLLEATFKSGGASARDVRLEVALACVMLGDLGGARRADTEEDLTGYIGKGQVAALPSRETLQGMKARVLFGLGMFHKGRGDDERAASFLKQAVLAAPGNSEIAFHTAKTLAGLGRRAQAFPLYKVAAKGGGHVEDAKSMVYSLDQERKRWPTQFYEERNLRKDPVAPDDRP